MRSVLTTAAALLLIGNAPDPAPVDDPQIPPPVRAMLEAAMATGSEGEVATVEKYGRLAAPEAANQIAEIAAKWRAARKDAATQALRDAQFLALVKGRAELGGFATTGNTNNVGISAKLDVKREGLKWRHKLYLLGEYQQSFGITSREHVLAAYEPNYKIDDRLYVYGATQFESDRFLGYFERYSASLGAGYSAIKKPRVTLDLELGPAFRRTRFTDQTIQSNLAARGSLDLGWRLSPGLTFTQDASAYVQSANSTLTSRSALAARLFGPLSAQFSYDVSYESKPPAGRVNTDTTSRASLVYTF